MTGHPVHIYCDGTIVLMSTKASNLPDGSPCIRIDVPDPDEASSPSLPVLVPVVAAAAVAISLIVVLILCACVTRGWWKRQRVRVPTEDDDSGVAAAGSARYSRHCGEVAIGTRDGEVPSQKELSSYLRNFLVVKFLVKRNLVPQMRNFSPTLAFRFIGKELRETRARAPEEGFTQFLTKNIHSTVGSVHRCVEKFQLS